MALAVAILPPAAAAAHPHVFIDNRVTFLFAENKIAGFRESWLFDDVFSDQLLQDYDADANGQFSKAESDKIGTETLPNLAQFHYFTYVWIEGKPLPKIPPKDFRASIKDKLVTFDFLVNLPKPIDPRQAGSPSATCSARSRSWACSIMSLPAVLPRRWKRPCGCAR